MPIEPTIIRPTKKVRDYDHDMASVEVKATELIAGDLVPGLGILDAILDPGLRGPGHDMVLCSGEDARIVKWFDVVNVHPAMCKVCAMHPIDCEYYGCDTPDTGAW